MQIILGRTTPFYQKDSENFAWIKSPECPDGTYSIVHFEDNGNVTQEIDCRTASLKEIAVRSGMQGTIEDVPSKKGNVNFAIAGNGYFALSCPNAYRIFTRNGHFHREPNESLVNSDGCALLNRSGRFFRSSDLDPSGCSSSGECVATVDPYFDEIYNLEYLNSYSFYAKDLGQFGEFSKKRIDKALMPTFFANALEDIQSQDRGPTSVSWVDSLHLNITETDCQ